MGNNNNIGWDQQYLPREGQEQDILTLLFAFSNKQLPKVWLQEEG